jgi:hypothetical protein
LRLGFAHELYLGRPPAPRATVDNRAAARNCEPCDRLDVPTGYGQLPVLGPAGNFGGQVVTFESILLAVQAFRTTPEVLVVRDIAQRAEGYPADADLLRMLEHIQRDNFVLIVDDSKLKGIVTAADATVFFQFSLLQTSPRRPREPASTSRKTANHESHAPDRTRSPSDSAPLSGRATSPLLLLRAASFHKNAARQTHRQDGLYAALTKFQSRPLISAYGTEAGFLVTDQRCGSPFVDEQQKVEVRIRPAHGSDSFGRS